MAKISQLLSSANLASVAILLDLQANSMMPPELEHNPMDNSTVAIQDLMQRTSLENEE